MQKKDSGATFLFAFVILGGVFAFLSQGALREGNASGGSNQHYNLDHSGQRYLQSDVRDSVQEGRRLLRSDSGHESAKIRCQKRPIFD